MFQQRLTTTDQFPRTPEKGFSKESEKYGYENGDYGCEEDPKGSVKGEDWSTVTNGGETGSKTESLWIRRNELRL